MRTLTKLTALWMHKDKNGEIYYSGKIGEVKIKVFKNTSKTEDKHPDFIIYFDYSEDRKKPE